MLPNLLKAVVTVALLMGLVVVGASPAQASGANPPLWYKFNVGRIDGESQTHVAITLAEQPSCSGGFQVFASGSWGFWDTPIDEDWMGVSSRLDNGTAMWSGKLLPGAYYVRIGTGAGADCRLGVNGKAVDSLEVVNLGQGMRTAAAPKAVSVHPTKLPVQQDGADFIWVESATPALTIAPKPAVPAPSETKADFVLANPAPAASTTAEAETVPGKWMPVEENESHMFTFFVGRVEDQGTSHVSVSMTHRPFRGGQFQVFTAEKAPWGQPENGDWLGHSNQIDGNHPSWSGDLVPGAYYVRVDPLGAKECLLAVSGQAVTF